MKMANWLKAMLVMAALTVCVSGLAACTNGDGSSNGGVAATVNGVTIPEDKVTEQVNNVRAQASIEDDDAWGEFLASSSMTPDEVRRMENRNALLFIRGERPVQDLKYDILQHPNVSLTPDGGAAPFVHGEDTRSIASVTIDKELLEEAREITEEVHRYEILSSEELDAYVEQMEVSE